MSSDDDVWRRAASLWGFLTAPLFVALATVLLDSQRAGCEATYRTGPFSTGPVPDLSSDWLCTQALNPPDSTALTVLGVTLGLAVVLVALVIITVRNRTATPRT